MRATSTFAAVSLLFFTLISGPLTAADTPETVYQKFHQAQLSGDMDAVLLHVPAAKRTEMAAYTPEQKQQLLKMMAVLLPRQVAISGKDVSADGAKATLYASGEGTDLLSGKEKTFYAAIAMVMEDGEWKVDNSQWSDQRPKVAAGAKKPSREAAVAPAPPPPPKPQPVAAEAAAPASEATPSAPAAPAAPASVAAAPEPGPPPARMPEKKKQQCIIKPVMSNADIERCRRVAESE
ncbi:MAG: hypothetical protein HYY48_04295 [Gammaproteobacteria bacterium]|nr:hypothetical protein [Gammaproteobacteria bacterium]